jgi:acetyl esterase
MRTPAAAANEALRTQGWTALSVPVTPALPARLYRAPHTTASTPLVLFFHGGKFIDGSLDSGDALARSIADAGAAVLALAYLRPPAHPFPEGLNGAYEALLWAHGQRAVLAGKRAPLFVAGEEAGANIAAALAMMARDQQRPALAGQILVSPMVDPCLGSGSLRAVNAGTSGCKFSKGWQQYLGTCTSADHPYAAPGSARRLTGLAPALVLTQTGHPLRDESLHHAQRLQDAGVAVQSHCLAGGGEAQAIRQELMALFLREPKRISQSMLSALN